MDVGQKVVFLVLTLRRPAVKWLERKIDARPKTPTIEVLELVLFHEE